MSPSRPSRSPEIRAEALRGFLDIAPLLLAAIPFALVLGTLAAGKGLSPLEVALMSALVFAGGAQFVAVGMWETPAPVIAIVLATAAVNLRHVLMGAALAPRVAHLPRWVRRGFVAVHADETWATALRRASHTPLTPGYLLGVAVPLYLTWTTWCWIGSLAGDLLGDPRAWGLDFVFPAVFIVLLIGLWRGRASVAPVAVGSAVALLAHAALPGAWYIFLGGLAGAIAGTLAWPGLRSGSRGA